MIELARFAYAGTTWAFAISLDPECRLLLSARDRRVYAILPLRAAGRVVPLSDLARLPDPGTGRVPWEGWYCAVILLGDAERRRVLYAPWPAGDGADDPLRRKAAATAVAPDATEIVGAP